MTEVTADDVNSGQFGADTQQMVRHDRKPDTDRFFESLVESVKMVCRGYTDAMMLNSPPGIGKSHQIGATMADELKEDEYHIHAGYCSPKALVEILYEHRDEVIFFDDIEGLVNDNRSVALLKQATWGEGDSDKRTVQWASGAGGIDCPTSFEFEGRVIMAFNELPDGPIVESLKNRCLFYPLSFTYEEKLKIISEIAKADIRDDMSFHEQTGVAQELVSRALENREEFEEHGELTLRTMIHCFDLYRYCRDELGEPMKWTEMAEEIMKLPEDEIADAAPHV